MEGHDAAVRSPLTHTRIIAQPDGTIGFGEMPVLDEAFWAQAQIVTLEPSHRSQKAAPARSRGRIDALFYAALFSAPVFSWKSGPLVVRVTKPSRIR